MTNTVTFAQTNNGYRTATWVGCTLGTLVGQDFHPNEGVCVPKDQLAEIIRELNRDPQETVPERWRFKSEGLSLDSPRGCQVIARIDLAGSYVQGLVPNTGSYIIVDDIVLEVTRMYRLHDTHFYIVVGNRIPAPRGTHMHFKDTPSR